jgi:cobalt/nickel transport system permease protein
MIHPAMALLCMGVYTMLMSQATIFYPTDCVPLVLLAYVRRRDLYAILRHLLVVNLFLGMVFVMLWWIEDQLLLAIVIFVRSNAMILFSLLLFYGRDPCWIIRGMQILRVPKKFVSVSFLAVKCIEILGCEMRNMKHALALRHFTPKSNVFTYQTIACMVGMLVVRTFYRTHRLSEAMTIRGFSGELYLINTHVLARNDWMLSVAMLVCVVPVFGFFV